MKLSSISFSLMLMDDVILIMPKGYGTPQLTFCKSVLQISVKPEVDKALEGRGYLKRLVDERGSDQVYDRRR